MLFLTPVSYGVLPPVEKVGGDALSRLAVGPLFLGFLFALAPACGRGTPPGLMMRASASQMTP